MDAQAAYQELTARFREVALLGSCSAVLGWDEQTYMPQQGADFRAEQTALLARMSHEAVTAPRIAECLTSAERSAVTADPQSIESANVRDWRRTYDRAVKLPKELVEEIARVTTRSRQVWQDARSANDFASFRPWLEKIVELKRQEAAAVGFADHPYDALLDEYEPGASSRAIRTLFGRLSDRIVPLIRSIADSSRRPNRSVLERDYPTADQESFAKRTAEAIGFNFQAGRLDVTGHPFCSGIGPGDCRITTRYNPRFFNEAFFGVMHEAGHGIYEQGLPPEHFGSAAGSFCSLGIHESQSRLWENQVGRSLPFWEHLYPQARQAFPNALTDVGLDDWYFAINESRPSFIRVEADEATYNLHIILRFELEMDLLTGDLPVAEIPDAWNRRFQAMFGMTPPDDRLGCLQDIHWSMGGIGYFPTYTLGNLYAAQFITAADRELGGLNDQFRRGDFAPLKRWLNERIHRFGRRERSEEMCRRVTGAGLQIEPFVNYLHDKFGKLYGL